MAKFIFKLESILSIKTKLEDQAKAEYGIEPTSFMLLINSFSDRILVCFLVSCSVAQVNLELIQICPSLPPDFWD